MIYMISYDLNKKDKDYEGVFQAIKDASTGVYIKVLLSVWLIKSNYKSATDVCNKIKPYLDDNDYILVNQVTDNRQGWLPHKSWEYINGNLKE